MAPGRKVGIAAVAVLILAVLGYSVYVGSQREQPDTKVNITQEDIDGTSGSALSDSSGGGPDLRDPAMTPVDDATDASDGAQNELDDLLNRTSTPEIVARESDNDTSDAASGLDLIDPDPMSADDAASTDPAASTNDTTATEQAAGDTGYVYQPYRSSSPSMALDSDPTPQPDTPQPAADATIDAPQAADTTTVRPATTYMVKSGDSLWKIAAKHYGNGIHHKLIADANPGINPGNLKVGTTLTLPALAEAPAPSSATDSQTSRPEPTARDPLALGLGNNARTVIVQPNEGLWNIAAREYQDGTKWRLIYNANRDKIKDANVVRAGTRLVIPPLSTE